MMFLNESSHPAKILDFLRSRGAAPALTWYAGENTGERIELSGKVCLNHLSKIANYLNFECGLESGGNIYLDLPACWKSLLWANAALLLGAKIHFLSRDHLLAQLQPQSMAADTNSCSAKTTTENQAAENLGSKSAVLRCVNWEKLAPDPLFTEENILVTDNPHFWLELETTAPESVDLSKTEIIALNTASFAFAWTDELPSNVLDGQAEVIGQPDSLLAPISSEKIDFAKSAAAVFSAKTKDCEAGEEVRILAADQENKRLAIEGKEAKLLLSLLFFAWSAGYAVMIYQGHDSCEALKAEGFASEAL